jgi:hypothetical protein
MSRDDEYVPLTRSASGRSDRQVRCKVEGSGAIGQVSIRTQRLQQQPPDRIEVAGVVIITLRRMATARVTIALGPMEPVDRGADGRSTNPVEFMSQFIGDSRLARCGPPVDRHTNRVRSVHRSYKLRDSDQGRVSHPSSEVGQVSKMQLAPQLMNGIRLLHRPAHGILVAIALAGRLIPPFASRDDLEYQQDARGQDSCRANRPRLLASLVDQFGWNGPTKGGKLQIQGPPVPVLAI